MKNGILVFVAIVALAGCGHFRDKKDCTGACGMKTDKPAHMHQHGMMAPGAGGGPAVVGVDAFINSPDLTAAQKEQLKAIYGRTFAQARVYQAELAEMKTKLFQTLASRDYKSKDITNMKKEITKLDQKRLDLMFGALSEVQGIVGYGADKEKIYKHLRDYDLFHGDRLSNIK